MTSTPFGPLRPPPYLVSIVAHLKADEPQLWEWFSSDNLRRESADGARFELLKSTYRMDRQTHAELYANVDQAARQLGIVAPTTLYQAQQATQANASLAWLSDEVHLVFHGPITSHLSSDELRAVIGHELAHYLLWHDWGREYQIADRILIALANEARAPGTHLATARLFQLYTETFCDRGAFQVCADLHTVITALVKIETGLAQVSAESYLRQAEEIFCHGPTKTDGLTHPECFIRTRAIQLWANRDPQVDLRVAEMIEGPTTFAELDWCAQKRVSNWTRRLIDHFLAHRWVRTPPVLAHARAFFPDYEPSDELPQTGGLKELTTEDSGLRDYFCYVLLDLVAADRDLEEYPLAAALSLADQFGCADRLAEIMLKELRMRKRDLDRIIADRERLLREVERTPKKKRQRT